jgi:hypothetical protein
MTTITNTVRIADLLRDHRFQVRQGLDRGTVVRYSASLAAGVEFPPVTVALVDGVPVLVDGWHRIEALLAIDRHMVEAVIVKPPLARLASTEANNSSIPVSHALNERDLPEALAASILAIAESSPVIAPRLTRSQS